MELINRSPEDWRKILVKCGVRETTAALWADPFADTVRPDKFSIGEEEIDDFLGQILHECGMLESMTEDLRYRPARIREMGIANGPNSRWAAAARRADEFGSLPSDPPAVRLAAAERLANFLYSGRYGNGDEASGDGWLFRGRGPIGLTFRDNYLAIGEIMGQDLVVLPHLIEQPRYALESAIAYWEGRIPDSCIGDLKKVTKRVNGGVIGIAHRAEVTNCAREALEACRA